MQWQRWSGNRHALGETFAHALLRVLPSADPAPFSRARALHTHTHTHTHGGVGMEGEVEKGEDREGKREIHAA